MALSDLYPELCQWLTHGGLLSVRPESEMKIIAWVGDAGGFPIDGSCTATTVDDLFAAVEKKIASWRVQNYELQQQILNDMPNVCRHDKEICVTGWPPIPNPHYDPSALPPWQEEA